MELPCPETIAQIIAVSAAAWSGGKGALKELKTKVDKLIVDVAVQGRDIKAVEKKTDSNTAALHAVHSRMDRAGIPNGHRNSTPPEGVVPLSNGEDS